MEIKAAEISSVIKDQISNFETKADVAEVGTVLSVGDGIARVYGLNNVCLSVPTVIGRAGVIDQVELDLWPKEKQGIQKSSRALKKILADVAVK